MRNNLKCNIVECFPEKSSSCWNEQVCQGVKCKTLWAVHTVLHKNIPVLTWQSSFVCFIQQLYRQPFYTYAAQLKQCNLSIARTTTQHLYFASTSCSNTCTTNLTHVPLSNTYITCATYWTATPHCRHLCCSSSTDANHQILILLMKRQQHRRHKLSLSRSTLP